MEELTGFEPAIMVLQTTSLTILGYNSTRKMAGMLGFEPRKCQIQSLVPYRLGYIPIYNMVGRAGFEPAVFLTSRVYGPLASTNLHIYPDRMALSARFELAVHII